MLFLTVDSVLDESAGLNQTLHVSSNPRVRMNPLLKVSVVISLMVVCTVKWVLFLTVDSILDESAGLNQTLHVFVKSKSAHEPTSQGISSYVPYVCGARCSSVVRAFALGMMVVGSILQTVDPLSYFSFQPVLTAGVTKVVVCAILSVGWCI